jgi:hypothetical protein
VQTVNILLVTPDAAEAHSRGPELQKILQNSNIYDVTLTVRTPLKHEQEAIERAQSVEEIDAELGKMKERIKLLLKTFVDSLNVGTGTVPAAPYPSTSTGAVV